MMSNNGLSKAQVEAYIDQFASTRVLVLGDVMLDRYFWGHVDRISPEAPVPVVKVERKSARLGGAANVAANLRALGGNVAIAGIMGDDRAGSEVRELLTGQGVNVDHIRVNKGTETTEKVRIIAQSQQIVRADFESEAASAAGESLGAVLSGVENDFDTLIISDYGKGVLDSQSTPDMIARWRAAGKVVLVDPHVRHFRWYKGATMITPNTKEAASYFDATIGREELFDRLGFKIREELDLDALLITRGEEGMSLFLPSGEQIRVPAVAEEVYDVTGAGDTVIAVLAAALSSGAPLIEAVVIANQAAGEVVKEIGTTTVTVEHLLNAF